MDILRLSLLSVGLALAAAQECDVCHLHYYHKDVSSKEVFGEDVTQCREYASESCCTPATTKSISTRGILYGEGYNMSSCNDVSEKCQKFFIEEMCFYECDKSMGKFRKHDDCAETASKTNNQAPHHLPANAWQISAMPVSATYCDAWYDACKDDDFCAGPSKSYFEMPQCLKANKENNNTAGCKRFSDVYANGKEVCEVMWDRSFKYETDESKAYVMSFPEGSPNPNNEIFIDRPYPAACSKHNVNVTHPHVDVITGERISAEAAGCAADWHRRDGSGYVMAGTAKTKTAGASPRSAAAAMIAAVLMLCLA